MLFFSHITYLGEESLSVLVYLVDVCQQLWTSVSSCAEKRDLWVFWEEMRREISFMFQLSINFVLDVSANIIKIETNKPSVEIQHMQDIDIYISHDGHTLLASKGDTCPVQQWEWRAKVNPHVSPLEARYQNLLSKVKYLSKIMSSNISHQILRLSYAIRIIFITMYYISTIVSFHLYVFIIYI